MLSQGVWGTGSLHAHVDVKCTYFGVFASTIVFPELTVDSQGASTLRKV